MEESLKDHMPDMGMDLKGPTGPMQSSAMRTDFLSDPRAAKVAAIKLQRAWRSFSLGQGSTRSLAAAFVASGVTCVRMAEDQPLVSEQAIAGLVAPADTGAAPFAVLGISTVVLEAAAAAPPCRVRVGPVPPAKATALSLNPRSSSKPLMEAFDAFADAMADPVTIKAAQASCKWKQMSRLGLLRVSAQSSYTLSEGSTPVVYTNIV